MSKLHGNVRQRDQILAVLLGHVEGAGRKTLTPKTLIAEGTGFFAHFLDIEPRWVAFDELIRYGLLTAFLLE